MKTRHSPGTHFPFVSGRTHSDTRRLRRVHLRRLPAPVHRHIPLYATWLQHRAPGRATATVPTQLQRPAPAPLLWPNGWHASTRWRRTRASRRPSDGPDGQSDGTRRVEGHHATRPQRVHLLGRGREASANPRTPHSPDPRGAGRRPAPALLLAGVQSPRTHRQIAGALPSSGTMTGGPVARSGRIRKARKPALTARSPAVNRGRACSPRSSVLRVLRLGQLNRASRHRACAGICARK